MTSALVCHADVRAKNIFRIISTLTKTVWSHEPERDRPYSHLFHRDNEIVSCYDKKTYKKTINGRPFSACGTHSVATLSCSGLHTMSRSEGMKAEQSGRDKTMSSAMLKEDEGTRRATVWQFPTSSRQLATSFTSAAGWKEVTLDSLYIKLWWLNRKGINSNS